MKSKDGFVQAYNAQAAVDADARSLSRTNSRSAAAIKANWCPWSKPSRTISVAGQSRASADSGYCSEPNLEALAARGIDGYVAPGRAKHPAAAGALRIKDLKRVNVDTTVQPKNVTFPTGAKLLHAAIKGLNRLARKHCVALRQSYLRVAKYAAMMASRYAHAKQFKRHHRELRFLRTRLGRLVRDIRRKIEAKPELSAAFAVPLPRADQIRSQRQRQRGWKLYSFHAPEVECIGKGKAQAPYEFGVKASIVTTNARAPGGQFVLHAKTLPGNPYDGHTLGAALDETETLTGCAIEHAFADKGYRGHNAKNPRRVFISGQKRGVFGVIKRQLKRRSAIEPAIGHMKSEGHLGRCFLKGRDGDATNAILSAAGYNFRRVR
jgi:transposase, IS5 family